MSEAEKFLHRLEAFVRAVVADAAPGADVYEAVAVTNARSDLLDFLLEEPS